MMMDWHRSVLDDSSTCDGVYEGQWYEVRRHPLGWVAVFHDDHPPSLRQTLGWGTWSHCRALCRTHSDTP